MWRKRKDAFHDCEKHPLICCAPKIDCADVAVKVRIVERPNPCKPNDIVLCYKICNFGPGVASRIFLKSFICPAPAKVCLKENKKLTSCYL